MIVTFTATTTFNRWQATAALAMCSVAVAGCFTTTSDFRNDAETFIETDQGLRDAVFPDADTTFEKATCVEPENQNEDTTFPCTATDSNGATWEFEVVITGKSGYEVNLTRRPPGA